jgi:O-antigen biosynthesis protein WbqV
MVVGRVTYLIDFPASEMLRRPERPFDTEAAAGLLQGRRVLITGAGGSVGGELARRVALAGPAHVSLLDSHEFGLFQIDHAYSEFHPSVSRRAILTDIRDEVRLAEWFSAERPDIVFHAAALKHVTLVENHPREGLSTNIVGAWNVARAAAAANTAAFVQISTDKAILPNNVMGASKRLAELAINAMPQQTQSQTRFVIARFGNVFGSSGSVVPLFAGQIARGGPLTLTHPDAERFFMSVSEAAQLVFAATRESLSHAVPGEVLTVGLSMGTPVRVLDLAHRMIGHAGLDPEGFPIRMVGLRPGEKLIETLLNPWETSTPTSIEGVFSIGGPPRVLDAAAVQALARFADTARAADARAEIFRVLSTADGPQG